MTYAQSVHLRQSRQAIRTWERRPLPLLPAFPPAKSARPPIDIAISDIDPLLVKESHLTEQDLRLAIRTLEETSVVDARLQQNTELLRVLQEAQWDRLRRAADARDPTRDTFREATPLENASANRLLEGLTSILNARPRVPDDHTSPVIGLDHATFASMKANLIQPQSNIYHGVLDPSNAKAIRESLMTSDHASTLGPSNKATALVNGAGLTPVQNQAMRKAGGKKSAKHTQKSNGVLSASALSSSLDNTLDKMAEVEGARIRATEMQ